MSAELVPCPCGKPCNTEEGPYPIALDDSLWRLDCVNPECGWSVISPTSEQCFIDWQNRATPPAQPSGSEGSVVDTDRLRVAAFAFVASRSKRRGGADTFDDLFGHEAHGLLTDLQAAFDAILPAAPQPTTKKG